jgi:hypothetical protein
MHILVFETQKPGGVAKLAVAHRHRRSKLSPRVADFNIFFHIRDRRENILNNGVQQKPLVTLLRAMHLSAEQFNEIEQGLATVVLKRLFAIIPVHK